MSELYDLNRIDGLYEFDYGIPIQLPYRRCVTETVNRKSHQVTPTVRHGYKRW